MLSPGRIPLTDDETQAVEKLLAKHAGESISLTRRDPGESGPVLVHVGRDTYEVDGAKSKKVKS
jgi:hypothetical protein